MMGVISTGAVVTASDRRGRPKTVQQGNREWVTVIQGINATGWTTPPFVIFADKHHLSAWYKEGSTPDDWVIAVSENSWTTNELGIEWLEHFNRRTKGRVIGSYRLLVLDGHESHNSIDFHQLCEDKKIINLPSACLRTCLTCCSRLMLGVWPPSREADAQLDQLRRKNGVLAGF
jgi:hypothetical protein